MFSESVFGAAFILEQKPQAMIWNLQVKNQESNAIKKDRRRNEKERINVITNTHLAPRFSLH